jgi:type IV secretory pathway VirB10-like protein
MDEIEKESTDQIKPDNEVKENGETAQEKPYQKRLRGGEPNVYAKPGNDPLLGPQLSKMPLIVAGSLVGLLLTTIAWGYLSPKSAVNFGSPSATDKRPEPGRAENIIANAPNTIAVNASQPNALKEEALVSAHQPATGPLSNTTLGQQGMELSNASASTDYQDQARIQMEMQREQEALQREAVRQAHIKEAKEASSTVFSNTQSGSSPSIATSDFQQVSNNNPGSSPLQGHLSSTNTSAYLPHTRMPAISPYEVKAGTVIPSLMLSGINSDLPGQLVAQVVQNVYDSATGKYLLIPQGAKLFGSYDHGVVLGQRRVLIVWNRIIYPDSSSLDLEGMSGQDQSGYAGFKDRMNNHVWPAFQQALLLSTLTAGVQLSQPRAQKGDYSYSSQQVVAGAMGMQLNQLGMSSYQGRSNLAPTISIRPGYRFNVIVNKDMVISPWQIGSPSQVPLQTAFRG